MTQFFGKYRGTVTNNLDPLMRGRIQAKVPSVTGGSELNWALPALPFAGSGVGFWAIPPIDANVWIEYEGGDPNTPIWSGGFWDAGDTPAQGDPLTLTKTVVLKTQSYTLTLNDMPGIGELTIETTTGMKITMSATSLEITNGMGASVKMEGPKVSINGSALEVT